MPGFAEDRGGNSVDVRFNGRKENLHSLWDTALVELEQGTLAEIAARIQAGLTDENQQQWQQGTPAQWALESRQQSGRRYIGCLRRARSQQITLGGHDQ